MWIEMSNVQEIWIRRGFISFNTVRSTFSYIKRSEHKLKRKYARSEGTREIYAPYGNFNDKEAGREGEGEERERVCVCVCACVCLCKRERERERSRW
jgi:hypothetical protein